MDEQDNDLPEKPQGGPPLGVDDAEVRLAFDQTRQALEASAAEIERAKRLLRETDELGSQAVPPSDSSNDGEPS